MSDCVRCARPVADTGYCCHGCATGLSVALLKGGLLISELDTTIARLGVTSDSGQSSAETPMPFDWDAADAAWAIRNTLTTWARHIHEASGRPLPPDRGVLLCAWLAEQVDWLRVRPEAEQAFDELHGAMRLLRNTIDTHAERWYAGICGAPLQDGYCERDLYAGSGAGWVTCTACGASFDAQDRKTVLLNSVRDHLTYAETIARALSAWGWKITSSQIRGYAHRHRLLPHGSDEASRPLYRVGDVIELLVARAA